MIVYYVADEEKPKDASGVQFFTNHSTALEYASDVRKSLYEFEVNDKCDTNLFGHDTQIVLRKDFETGELKFLASGNWVDVHNLLNVPFYYDFESRSKTYVSMSLKYFNEHYSIVENKVKEQSRQVSERVETKPVVKPVVKPVETKPKASTGQNKAVSEGSGEIDADVLNELFGVSEDTKSKDPELTKFLF